MRVTWANSAVFRGRERTLCVMWVARPTLGLVPSALELVRSWLEIGREPAVPTAEVVAVEATPPWSLLDALSALASVPGRRAHLGMHGVGRVGAAAADWVIVVRSADEEQALRSAGVQAVVVLASPRHADGLPLDPASCGVVVVRDAARLPDALRLVAPGGHLLAECPGDADYAGLRSRFGLPVHVPTVAASEIAANLVEAAGLEVVELRRWEGEAEFPDIAAVIAFLRANPRVVPGFGVDAHLGTLLDLQDEVEAGAPLRFGIERWFVNATLPVLRT